MEVPMLTVITLILSHLAVGAAGIFAGPKLEAWLASWTAARTVKAAQAVVNAEIARVTALENARATIVAHKTATPSPAATGATGPTGA